MSRPAATDRLARVLALVPWVAERDGPTVEEVCARFDVSERELAEDFEVLFLIGLPPYTPDALVDAVIEDGRVWIRYADFFARPLRLTPEEGLALVAAGAALRGLPGHDGDGPLARALDKLAGVLGVDPDLVDTGAADRQVLQDLARAVDEHRVVELDYYSYGRDERTTRTVEPWRVFHEKGAWYVMGHCHQAGGERIFRIDRIEGLELRPDTFEPPDGVEDVGVFQPSHDDPRVTLDLGPAARWVADQYPVEQVEERSGGGLRVRLAIAARPWLERLLLRLGDQAQVVDTTDPGLVAAGREAATRVLARYAGG